MKEKENAYFGEMRRFSFKAGSEDRKDSFLELVLNKKLTRDDLILILTTVELVEYTSQSIDQV